MKTHPSLQNGSFDDIVFENRNKIYGAFDLRSTYEKRLLKSMLALVLLTVLLLYVFKTSFAGTPVVPKNFWVADVIDYTQPPVTITPPKDEPTPPQQTRATKAVATQLDPKNFAATTQPITTPTKTFDPNKAIGPVELPGITGKGLIALPTGSGTGTALPTKPQTMPLPPAKVEPSRIADVMPTYVGGQEAMAKFIRDKSTDDRFWVDMGLTGTVYVDFTVTETGEVIDVKTIRSPHKKLSLVAEQCVKAMPNWKPGVIEGKNVAIRMTMPISFKTK